MKSTKRKLARAKPSAAYQVPAGFGAMRVADDIVPFGEFKAKASALFRRLRAERRPLVVTQHGRAAGVVVPPDEWDAIQYERRLRAAVVESLAQADRGELIEDAQLGREIETWFGGEQTA